MSPDIVALGELLIDFSPISTDASGYPTVAAHPGGAPANFLAAAQKSGLSAAFIGKVGDDMFGRLLVSTLSEAGIETGGIVVSPDVFTTLAFVAIDKNGDRSFSFSRKPGADTCLSPSEIDYSLIDGCRVFHFGTLSLTDEPARSATKEAVAYAKARGKLISFDPNYREPLWRSPEKAKEAMLWGLSQADLIKISDEECAFLFGLTPAESAEHLFRTFQPKLVFVTCGKYGCVYQNAAASGAVPGLRGVRAVDTTGAGDIFGGSAAAAVLKSGKAPEDLSDEELRSVADYAVRMSGLSVTRYGGISSVPDPAEAIAFREEA